MVCNNNNPDQNLAHNISGIGQVQSGDMIPAVKFLGVFFDPDLNFKFHIGKLKNKLSRALFALRSVKNTLSKSSLQLLYNSIFNCHLLYAIQIWSCTNSSLINELFKLQKAAVRIISGSKYNAHTEPLFKNLQILPLPDLISFSKLQFMQRFSQKMLPISFNDIWVKNNVRNIGENEIQLRNYNQLQPVHSTLAKLDIFPLYNYPKIWQDFPNEQIKIIRKTAEFDQKLKNCCSSNSCCIMQQTAMSGLHCRPSWTTIILCVFVVVFGSLLSSPSSNSYQNGQAAVLPVPFLSIFNNLTNVHWLGPFKSPPPLNCHPTWHRNL